jgi:hypothetical protein
VNVEESVPSDSIASGSARLYIQFSNRNTSFVGLRIITVLETMTTICMHCTHFASELAVKKEKELVYWFCNQ